MNAIAITFGTGLRRPKGTYTKVPPPPVDELARMLSSRPSAEEDWWSPHLWKENLRQSNAWLASSGVAVDIDYEADGAPFPEHVAAIVELARDGQFPGNLFHLTPHGARVVAMFDQPCSEKDDVLRAATGFGQAVARVVAGTGYKVDETCHKDLARLFFTPNSIAKGVQRHADVMTMRREPYGIAALAKLAEPPPTAPKPTPVRRIHSAVRTFDEAAAEWNYDHRRTYPRHSSECPVCHDKGSFGHLPDDEERWHCFSTDHPAVGVKGDKGYHGDALDLEAFERGCKRVDVLRRDGYLEEPTYYPAPTTDQIKASESAKVEQKEAAQPIASNLVELGLALTPEIIAAQKDPIPTGLVEVDEHLGGGYYAGELTVFQAMTGQGKSTFNLMAQCRGVATDPQRAGLYVTTELRPEELQARRACQVLNEQGVNCSWRDILKGTVPIERTREATKDTRIFVLPVRPGPKTLETIKAAAHELGNRFGKPPLVVADYLQALSLGEEERRLAVGNTIYALQTMASDLRTVMVAISSISRTGTQKERRDSNDPYDFVSLAKEAGEVELAAAVLVHLDVKAEEDERGWREARAIIAKSRFGRLGIVGLRYHGKSGRFEVDQSSALSDDEWQVLIKVHLGTYSSANGVAKAINKNRPKVLKTVSSLQAKKLIETKSGYLVISRLVATDQLEAKLSD